ncbi:MAG: flavodoxin family protein [Anaerolineae bacterium]|nr:flavodoxin family protein [Anaerolineae bacterium]
MLPLVLGLAGSPRRRGNTAMLLERALAGAAEAGARVASVELCRLRIAPCVACDGCFRTGVCVVRDDFQAVLPQLLEADAVILASPLYFLGVTAWAKAFIDRCQCLWARRYILHEPLPPTTDGRPRRAIFLCTAGTPNAPFSGAVATVKAWLRTLDAEYLGDVLCRGIDLPGAIAQDAGALEEAYRLGKALAG